MPHDKPEKGSSFVNQKQLRKGSQLKRDVWRLAGKQSIDNRIDVNETEDNLDFRMSMPAGGPFMHPMHDATADPQLDTPEHKTKFVTKPKHVSDNK